ncbi:MAG: hypothetical protein IVW57_00045 [Ktedonobacterales bacterium]|nr:hypothetical protein [Ktedonobacterales bacterium]
MRTTTAAGKEETWDYDPRNGYDAIRVHALTELRINAGALRNLARGLHDMIALSNWHGVERYLREMETATGTAASAAEWLREWGDEPEAWQERYGETEGKVNSNA